MSIPNNPTEVSIEEEQLEMIKGELNSKKIVKINGSYYNTTYIAKIVPDIEANRLVESTTPKLEKTTQTTQDKYNREAIEKMKEKLFGKK
ncbi:MAG: hypothetical protein ABIK92_04600 [Pseudomonadota bacterium]